MDPADDFQNALLADQVAHRYAAADQSDTDPGAKVAGFGKTKDEWVAWLDTSVSQPGQNLLEFTNHFVRTMGDTFPPNVKRQAEKVYRAAQQLDREIGELFMEMGK